MMIFGPDLIGKVLDGTKDVTRRRLHGRPIRYKVGHTYAVQPGRGKEAVGRIRVTGVRTERLSHITTNEVRREGFTSFGLFMNYWIQLHGTWDPEEEVAVIEFELVE